MLTVFARSRRLSMFMLLSVVVVPAHAGAQAHLSLADAITRAGTQNLDAKSAEVAERRAAYRVSEARAGLLPVVEASETLQRGNQPVFVFGSLLGQRRFAASNFAIDALNRPDAVGNLRTALSIEQGLFDPVTRTAVHTATLAHEAATIGRSRLTQDLAVAVTGAYGAVLSADAVRLASTAAVETATADLALARNRRDAGVVTDADVLQVEVSLAQMRAQQIRANADVSIARARLNQILGEPLDTVFDLEVAPAPSAPVDVSLAALEAAALAARPDVKLAALQEQLAASAVDAARAAFLPRVTVQAGWEANSGVWHAPASSWVVGAAGQINVFRGFADRARIAEAREQQSQRALERQQADIAVRLDVRVALAQLEAARAAEVVGRAAVAQARESHRIIRDRYEGGLVDVSALVRAAEVVQQADARQAAAHVDVMLAGAALDRAVGTR